MDWSTPLSICQEALHFLSATQADIDLLSVVRASFEHHERFISSFSQLFFSIAFA